MRVRTILMSIIVGVSIGATSTFLYLLPPKETWATEWRDVALNGKSVGYSSEASLNSNLGLPEMRRISGRWKFIQRSPSSGMVQLGYLVHAVTGTSKLAQKYVKDTPIGTQGSVLDPVPQADYRVHLRFVFKDKDGFKLLSLESDPLDLLSGDDNLLQGLVEQPISVETAALTQSVVIHLVVDKCAICK
jgi:hypothetical protein